LLKLCRKNAGLWTQCKWRECLRLPNVRT